MHFGGIGGRVQYMPSAFSIRADTEFLNRVRLAAKEAGVSLTTYVTAAVEMRMAVANAGPDDDIGFDETGALVSHETVPERTPLPPLEDHKLRATVPAPNPVVAPDDAPGMKVAREALATAERKVAVAPERTFARDPKTCPHSYQTRAGYCPSCGHQR